MLLDNYRLAEQVQQYCYLAPGVINVDSVAEMPRHIQAGRKSDRIGKDCVK